MKALLTLNQVTRRFGGLVAVDRVSMRIEAGEIYGLIGPNGAGKTTILDLVSGLTRPSSGHIELAGENVTGLRADRLAAMGIRRTFQNLKLFNELTVLQNVMIGLHASGRAGVVEAIVGGRRHRREERAMRAASLAVLDAVGLSERSNQRAAALSYGHRRRLEIARALVAEPRLLLLDEPAAGLNPSEATGLVDLIARINEQGVTILLVEHHMDVIMASCSRITVLNYGRKLAEGVPAEIRADENVIEAYLGRPGLEERLAGHA